MEEGGRKASWSEPSLFGVLTSFCGHCRPAVPCAFPREELDNYELSLWGSGYYEKTKSRRDLTRGASCRQAWPCCMPRAVRGGRCRRLLGPRPSDRFVRGPYASLVLTFLNKALVAFRSREPSCLILRTFRHKLPPYRCVAGWGGGRRGGLR